MNISITKGAVDWFKQEMDAQPGDSIRFFARYGGCSTVQSGFSLGVAKDTPHAVGISTVVDGMTFYMEDDLWDLNVQDLVVDFDEASGELRFSFE
ncbi:HesB/YadR/YfhF family protein [Effusibacillus lacus]|uniref:FeS cluster biogenesis domain-containing protein n=1 Tax=Effusibacillus lacus TaxID=1348429 RepID=A0A292YNE8_9BACL|nr:HesB/YadR/YfhF family protein [Effusibacillus lacus]TCS76548.1 uncharacterized protein YneR [Effusibacillus lacus]GAX90431.1 hypothetical protein EFBL_2058 [Effusibacillus lacus]